MEEKESISPAIKKAAEEVLSNDPTAKRIYDMTQAIDTKQSELDDLSYELSKIKKKRQVYIRWRDSVKWCLQVDASNPFYFLKSASGVYKCIAFKHKIDINADMKNKIATTLSSLYKEKSIGRIMHDGSYHYGLTSFFKDDLNELKLEYENDLAQLKPITVKL